MNSALIEEIVILLSLVVATSFGMRMSFIKNSIITLGLFRLIHQSALEVPKLAKAYNYDELGFFIGRLLGVFFADVTLYGIGALITYGICYLFNKARTHFKLNKASRAQYDK